MACSRRRMSIITVASEKQGRRWARDDRRPPQGGAREACVLDGSERRAIRLAVGEELRGLSARPTPSLCSLGVPFRVESCPPRCLDSLQPSSFGLGQLWQAS